MVETVVTVERTQTSQTAAPPVGGAGGGLSALTINIGYFTTVPGIIKLVQFVVGIICMACASPAYIGASSFFLFVAAISFIATVLWSFAYLLNLREKFSVTLNWILTECYNTGINAVFYLIASIVQLVDWFKLPADTYIFGIICMACATPNWYDDTTFFLYVAIISFIPTVLFIFVYLLNFSPKFEITLNFLLKSRERSMTLTWILLIIGIICMACASPAYIGATSFFLFVVVTAFIATLLWIIIYLFGLREALTISINWMLTEFINTGVSALLYFIAFIVQLACWSGKDYYILGIICMACASPAYIGPTSFFLFVVVIAFIATLLWIFAYLLGIREALNVAINWIFSELINTGVASVLYFIAFVVQLAKWSSLPYAYAYGSNIAAGVFGLFNFLAYAAGTYFLFLEFKSGAIR